MSPDKAPEPTIMRLGWVPRSWRGAKLACVKCGRRVRSGTVHISERDVERPTRVLCNECITELMAAGRPEAMN